MKKIDLTEKAERIAFIEEQIYENYGSEILQEMQDLAGIVDNLNNANIERYFYLLLGAWTTLKSLNKNKETFNL